MHLTNTMSAWAQNNQNWTASKQATSKRASSSSSCWSQILSPPEGILEAKVSNPQKICRSEMTCGDHSDPEVGSWVMDNPQVPWRHLLKSLRQDCESIQTMWKHSNQPVKLKQETLPHKFKIRGSGDTLPEMGPPDANSLWPNCWPQKG